MEKRIKDFGSCITIDKSKRKHSFEKNKEKMKKNKEKFNPEK